MSERSVAAVAAFCIVLCVWLWVLFVALPRWVEP